GATDAKERHARLASDGAREQRLAGARRSDQQDAVRNPRAKSSELLGVLQELDDLLELLLRFFDAGDVGKRDRRLVPHEHARAAFAKRERLIVRALGLA